MISRYLIVKAAREWIGTPFRHQARVKGVGADCGQLVIGVGLEAGAFIADPTTEHSVYGRLPNPRRMQKAIEALMVEIPFDQARAGDVLWMHWRVGVPMHLAILAEHEGRRTMIHAYSGVGRVTEHGFCAPWTERVSSAWRYPKVGG